MYMYFDLDREQFCFLNINYSLNQIQSNQDKAMTSSAAIMV